MAGLNLQLNAGELSITSVAKTCLTIKAPAQQRIKLKGFEICGKGIANTDTPVKVEIGLITTDGGTSTALTANPLDGDTLETPQGTYAKNYTVEPTTYGAIVRTFEVHPQISFVYMFPMGLEIVLKGGQEIGFRMTSNQVETMSLNAIVEE